jgi:signal transduction histidine kinase/CheY-like chemotaxis protein
LASSGGFDEHVRADLELAEGGIRSLWQVGEGGALVCRWADARGAGRVPPTAAAVASAIEHAEAMPAPNLRGCRVVAVGAAGGSDCIWPLALCDDGSAWLGELPVEPLAGILRGEFGSLAALESRLVVVGATHDLVRVRPVEPADPDIALSRRIELLGSGLRVEYDAQAAPGLLAGIGPMVLTPLVALGVGMSVLVFLIARELAESAARQRRLSALGEDLRRRDRDIQRGRAEAEAASAAKSDLLRRTSHNIRSPLTNIIGTTDLLLSRGAGDEEWAQQLRSVHSSAQHLLALANELLDLAHAESGRVSIAMEDVDIAGLLGELLDAFRPRVNPRRVELAVRWESAAPLSVRTDPTRIREILTNLLDNAVRHTERGGVVIGAAADAEHGTLTLRVSDTGPGIAADRLPRLFEADAGVARREGAHGAGLGLAITRHLTAALGGTIEASSVSGGGTTFTLRLRTAVVWPARAVGAAEASAAPGVRALVVDDAAEVRHYMLSRLEREGICAVEAGSRADAVAAAKADARFDIVFLDMHLLDSGGGECLAALRPLLPRAMFVAFTGDAGAEARAGCLTMGFDAYLPKPFNDGQLASVLAAWREAQDRRAA